MSVQGSTYDYSKLTVTNNPTTASTAAASKTTLGQDQFLKLMTTQMTHQDPSQPMQNGEFLTQMAQFGTVAGIQDLQKSFTDFANTISSSQALQASGLVGRDILAPGTQGVLTAGGNVSGNVNLDSSVSNVHITITDPVTGQVVREMDTGAQEKGDAPFSWDGTNANGAMANPGVYQIQATADINGKNTVLTTDIDSRVSSVTMGNGSTGLKVNLSGGLGSIDFNKIKQIL